MESTENNAPVSRTMFWISWVISAIPVFMLLMSASFKFIKPDGMEEGMKHIGWEMGQLTVLGIVELVCTVLYVIPRTSILGAILVTAYLGGATATHVRVGDPFYVTVGLGILVWLALHMREPRLRSLVPLRT